MTHISEGLTHKMEGQPSKRGQLGSRYISFIFLIDLGRVNFQRKLNEKKQQLPSPAGDQQIVSINRTTSCWCRSGELHSNGPRTKMEKLVVTTNTGSSLILRVWPQQKHHSNHTKFKGAKWRSQIMFAYIVCISLELQSCTFGWK